MKFIDVWKFFDAGVRTDEADVYLEHMQARLGRIGEEKESSMSIEDRIDQAGFWGLVQWVFRGVAA